MEKINKIRLPGAFGISDTASLITAAFLFVCSGMILYVPEKPVSKSFLEYVSLPYVLVCTLLAFALLAVLRLLLKKTAYSYVFMLASAVLYGVCLIVNSPGSIYLTVTVIAILYGFIHFTMGSAAMEELPRVTLSERARLAAVLLMFAAAAFFIAWQTILRYRVYNASNYDFGIFAQMFHNMKTIGLPITSCERFGRDSLSHFAVHFSPVFYLFLPGYMIFSRPEYLLVIQAVFVCAAVIPLYLICRHFKLPGWASLALCAVLLTYPASVSGAYYDFHENKFLTFFILFFIYFILKRKYIPAYAFAALTLAVKEDAK